MALQDKTRAKCKIHQQEMLRTTEENRQKKKKQNFVPRLSGNRELYVLKQDSVKKIEIICFASLYKLSLQNSEFTGFYIFSQEAKSATEEATSVNI